MQSGAMTPKTLVWVNGMADWRPLGEVMPEYAHAIPVHVPAPPPPAPAPLPAAPPPAPAPVYPAAPSSSAMFAAGASQAVASAASAAVGAVGIAAAAGSASGAVSRRSHEVEYEILGGDLQVVEIELDPGETVIAEAGAMNYMDGEIQFETKMGDGSNPNPSIWNRLKQVGKRMLTGESLFMTHFTNRGPGKKRVAFAGPYPGRIMPVDLTQLGGTLLCQKDAFLCAAFGTKVGIAFAQKIGTGLFGGEGFILQKLEGDGLAFLHAGGMIVKKELRGNTLLVDTGCLVAFTQGVDYSIQRAGNLKSMVFGGEGLFLATLRGHGTVWVQTLPLSKLADRLQGNAVGGRSDDSGGLLGGLGNMFES
jgi:uncharacterized protein (TIGR00266 family)